jgi:tRNA A37 threonylcarbamoyltransferase TsaD
MRFNELKPSIISSWRHVGISPFERSKIEQMIKNESPDESFLNHPAYQIGIEMAFEKLNELDNLTMLKRKKDEAEKEAKKKLAFVIQALLQH